MTISNPYSPIEYTSDGSSTEYSFTFPAIERNDVKVFVGTTELTYGTDYTVLWTGETESEIPNLPNTGKIILEEAATLGDTITISRETDIEQETDFDNNTTFSGKVLEQSLDKITLIQQETMYKIVHSGLSTDASDVSYDNNTSGLSAENVQAAIDELEEEIDNVTTPDAGNVVFDPSDTGMSSTNVQDAIEEAYNNGGGSGGDYTDEDAQDAVGGILTDTTTIDFTYSDSTPSITADVKQDGIDHGSISGLSDDDHTQYHNDTRADTWLSSKDTDDVSEGSTNLYYTDTRVDSRISSKDSDDISEGETNLYFTNERVDDRVASLMTDTDTIGFTYNDGDNTLEADFVGDAGDITFTPGESGMESTDVNSAIIEAYENGGGGGGSSNSFETISVSGQDDVVASSSTDTLTLAEGGNISITTNAATDTITIGTSGLTIGTDIQAYDLFLQNLSSLATQGFLSMTSIASQTVSARVITGGGAITVTNGNGASGNPTISLGDIPTSGLNFDVPSGGSTNVTVKASSGSSAYDFVLPTSAGSSGEVLSSSGGSGALTWESTSGRLINVQSFTTSGTYTATAGAKNILVKCVGGGGAGGAYISTNNFTSGGGGGAGAYSESWLSVSSANGQTVTIGSGGSGGAGNGGSGTGTSLGSLVTAGGGSGALANNGANAGAGGAGGSAGTANIIASGGAAGSGGIYDSASFGLPGMGGDSLLGGGAKAAVNTAGSNAPGYGGGGSGAGGSTSSRDGGDGHDGILIIYEYA